MTIDFFKPITKSAVVSAIRRLFARSLKVKYVRERQISKTHRGPRGGKMYECETCGNAFGARETQVDHMDEVIELSKTTNDYTLDELLDRIDCNVNNLQLLCKDCHKKKTKAENEIRKQFKKAHKKYLKRKEKENEI